MRTIGNLIYCAGMLKNIVIHITLLAIAPEYLPSEENGKCNDAKEEKKDDKEDARRMVINKNRDINKEIKLSTHQLGRDIEEHVECEEEDERDWQEKFFHLRKTRE